MSYNDYLQSKDWNDKRKVVYKMSNHTCQLCRAKNVKLNAHHIRYGKLEKVSISHDLMCLCEVCHTELHNLIKLGKIISWDTYRHGRKKPTKKKYRRYLRKKFRHKKVVELPAEPIDYDFLSHMNSIHDEIHGTTRSITYSKGL